MSEGSGGESISLHVVGGRRGTGMRSHPAVARYEVRVSQ